MRYSIVETDVDVSSYDFRQIKFLKPTRSWDTLRANLSRLSSLSPKLRKFTVYFGSVPILFVSCCRNTIVDERESGDFRKDYEKDQDFFYAERSRLKAQRVGFAAGDLTAWIKQEPESVRKAKQEARKELEAGSKPKVKASKPRRKRFKNVGIYRKADGSERRIKFRTKSL